MPTITVNIALIGHPTKELDEGGNVVADKSAFGHMWITLPNGDTSGLQRDPNEVVDTDGETYQPGYYSKEFEISEEDMRSLQDLVDYPDKYGFGEGEYDPFTNRTGYSELSDLDSNADGVIDAKDDRFADLRV